MGCRNSLLTHCAIPLAAQSGECPSVPVSLTTLKALDAEIKLLEAQKKLVEKRDGDVPKALAVIQKYAKLLTATQRRQLAKLIGEDAAVVPAAGPKAARTSLKGRKLGKVAPKYRLPSGETWTGRGAHAQGFRRLAEVR